MPRLFLTLAIVGIAFALAACGGSSDDKSTSGATGPQGLPATGVSGPAGTSGSTAVPPTAKNKNQKGAQGKTTPGTTTTPSGTAKAPNSKSGGGSKKFRGVELDLYKQGKIVCPGFPIEQLAREYKAKSQKPKDVARAYANAYVPAKLSGNREAFYEGCLAGLQAKAR
jgi:hypothetical protein